MACSAAVAPTVSPALVLAQLRDGKTSLSRLGLALAAPKTVGNRSRVVMRYLADLPLNPTCLSVMLLHTGLAMEVYRDTWHFKIRGCFSWIVSGNVILLSLSWAALKLGCENLGILDGSSFRGKMIIVDMTTIQHVKWPFEMWVG